MKENTLVWKHIYSLCCLTSESLRNNFYEATMQSVCINIYSNNYRKFYVYDCGLHLYRDQKLFGFFMDYLLLVLYLIKTFVV